MSDDITKYIRSLSPKFGFGLLGETIYRLKYSRHLPDGGTETWADTVIRVINGSINIIYNHYNKMRLHWDEKFWQDKAKNMAVSMFNMEWLPPGRGLWAMGTDFLNNTGSAALNNCAAVSTVNLPKAAEWSMYMLMVGLGIGFDTAWNGEVINPNKRNIKELIIPDNREGWSISTEWLISCYMPGFEKLPFPKFNYSKIRVKGKLIKSFGGVSSGPGPLIKLHQDIEKYLDNYCEYVKFKSYGLQRFMKMGADELNSRSKFHGDIVMVTSGPVSDPEKDIALKKRIFTTPHAVPYEDDTSPSQTRLQTFMSEKLSIVDEPSTCEKVDNGQYIELNREDINYDKICNYDKTRCVADIFNSLAECVSAGGVRRSAQIILGSPDDKTFLDLKSDEMLKERGKIAYNSNNSVVLSSNEDFDKYIPTIANMIRYNGEPGIINLLNIQKYERYGRIGRKDMATLSNPCGEIPLESFEVCNLVTAVPNRCTIDSAAESDESKTTSTSTLNIPNNSDVKLNVSGNLEFKSIDIDKFSNALRNAVLYATAVTLLPTERHETNEVIARNRRIGVSLSGVADIYDMLGAISLTKFLKHGYKIVKDENEYWSKRFGIPPAIRLTTVKPDGKISILAGVNPGIHHSIGGKYYINRIRIEKYNPVCQILRDANVPCVSDPNDNSLDVFEFPCKQESARPSSDVSVWEQFNILTMMQREWSDNMVSCTIYFDPVTEGKYLEKVLGLNAPVIKSVSMLPRNCESYPLMPYESITKEKYILMSGKLKTPDWKSLKSGSEMPRGCDGDRCYL